jgi:hypothetical protein
MMRRLGILGLASLAVLALSSAGAASASAAKCEKKVGSKHYIVCVNGEKLGSTASESISSTLKSGSKAKLGFYENYVPVGCTSQTLGVSGGLGLPTLKNGGAGSAVLTGNFNFSGCSIEGEGTVKKTCSTFKTMEWRSMNGAFGPAGGTTFKPTAGEVFGEYWATGEECPPSFTGPHTIIKGAPECTLTNLETETLTKELLCTGAKSYFKQSSWGNVTFRSESIVELSGLHKGQTFSVVEG